MLPLLPNVPRADLKRCRLLAALFVLLTPGGQGIRVMAAPTHNLPRVHVIAPASKTAVSELAAIERYITEQLGLPYTCSTTLYGDDLLYANRDELRAEALVNALTDDSPIIWSIRGGYGTARLIPYLERLPEAIQAKIRENSAKKIVIGYSDLTALQLYLQKKYQWPVLQAAMLSDIINHKVDPRSVEQLLALITGRQQSLEIPHLTPMNQAALQQTTPIVANVVGGNLTLVETSIGSCWQLTAADQILLLEDVALPPAGLERRLDHLHQAGLFDGVKAVILGDFTQSGNQPLTASVKQRFADSASFPVFSVAGVGHGYQKTPVPLNTQATLQPMTSAAGPFSLTVAAPYQ